MRYRRTHVSLYLALVTGAVACSDGLGPAIARPAQRATMSAATSNAGAPTPTGFELTSDDLCPGISLRLEASGKTKTLVIGKAGAVTIFLSPGQDARLTNISTGKTVTLSISGAFHQTVTSNGDVVTVITGRNLTFDPEAEIHFALTAGLFTYIFDVDGNLVQPREGTGLIVDVCNLIA